MYYCGYRKGGRAMSRAEELAKQLYPDPKLEDYDDILVYRTDRDNALMGRSNVRCVYEQAEKDIAKALLAKYKEEADKCPDADYDHDYTVAETQQYGRFMMMEDIYEEFCEPVGVTLDDLEDEL